MKIIKRSGTEVEFEPQKIVNAVRAANKEALKANRLSEAQIQAIANRVEIRAQNAQSILSVEDIQDMVEICIMECAGYEVAQRYIRYRYLHEQKRKCNTTDEAIFALIERENEEIKQENSNKNPIINSVQRDYMAGEVSKDISKRFLLPEDVVAAHEAGQIKFHDMDYYAQHMHNCCLVNLEDMLQNGTVISETMIDRPHSFYTACNIATQAVAQIASAQYGGQSISLTHLAPFVQVSREKFREQVSDEFASIEKEISEEELNTIVEKRVKEEIRRGVQTIQYQVITLMTTNGQAPFISVFMYLNEAKDEQTKKDLAMIIEEVLKQRIQGTKNEKGAYITPAFPKLLYVLEDDNVYPDGKYYYLTELAAKCTAKRLVPDYISEKYMKQLKNGHVYPCMGCRSFLTPDRFSETKGNLSNAGNFDEHKGDFYYGRFNQGVVTINLVDVACASGGDEKLFWNILDERLELCHKALQCRHKRLLGTPSDVAPIMWQYGALARLKKGEPIDKLLYDGYSTISLGYAGLYEMTMYMKNVSHTEETVGRPFAIKVMQHLNDKCTEWKNAENIDYSVYGTPLESTTYEFAKKLQKKYGIIKNVTDHNYITNSYHVNVREQINAFQKLEFESVFQELSPGGAISYVEVPNMQNNIDAVIAVIQYIYEHIMYAELNTKSDYCMQCGYDGEIQIVEEEETKKLIWECPKCGNRNQDMMSVARRTCGYIGTQFWNQGRTQEIKDRVMHL